MALGAMRGEPDWYANRKANVDWEQMVGASERRRADRDDARAEMRDVMIAGCDVLQIGRDWTLQDCERFSLMLAQLAEGVTYIRASVGREGALQ